MFDNIDINEFWNDNEYAMKEYVSDPPSDELISEVERELGYKLPASYIRFMKMHNGGIPRKTYCQPVDGSFPVAIEGFYGIGREKANTLCGEMGTAFWLEEWEYPAIGVVICDTISAGHDMIFLDYTQCGRDGEPCVVDVDQEADYRIVRLADTFEAFIGKLSSAEELGLDQLF